MQASQVWGRSNEEIHPMSKNWQAFTIKARASLEPEVGYMCVGRGHHLPQRKAETQRVEIAS